jgi:hypothetical protein
MVSKRNNVDTVLKKLVIDLRCQPGAPRRVLRIDYHAVNVMLLYYVGQSLRKNMPARPSHNIANTKNIYLHIKALTPENMGIKVNRK